MSATAYATTAAGIVRALTFQTKPVLADVISFARGEWPTLAISAHTLFRVTPADTLEFVKERARRELARDNNRRAAKHWSCDGNRSIAIRQFIALVERFERHAAKAA
jgi:hypothetical protein